MLKKLLRSGLPIVKKIVDYAERNERLYSYRSYAQEGEDMILREIFTEKKNGVYVDIGAHHPLRFSNTYFFYLLGWRGINIDAAPGSMKTFDILRPGDTNLELGIAESPGEMIFTVFDEPALNTFDEAVVKQRVENTQFKVVDRVKVKTSPLSAVLEKHLDGRQIDFMSVDAEGYDLVVLKSNDWKRFKPKVLLVEVLQDGPLEKNDIHLFLTDLGYHSIARTTRTFFYSLGL